MLALPGGREAHFIVACADRTGRQVLTTRLRRQLGAYFEVHGPHDWSLSHKWTAVKRGEGESAEAMGERVTRMVEDVVRAELKRIGREHA
jgi:hypothetical protein